MKPPRDTVLMTVSTQITATPAAPSRPPPLSEAAPRAASGNVTTMIMATSLGSYVELAYALATVYSRDVLTDAPPSVKIPRTPTPTSTAQMSLRATAGSAASATTSRNRTMTLL